MFAIKQIQNVAKESYVLAIIILLGIFAFFSAVLIAWPALAYLGAKMFV